MTTDALPTPCLVIDRPRMEDNLRRMQEKAARNGVALRPHTKTHKSVALARRQVTIGARGLAVAKVAEAEVYVAAGFDDIRIAYTIVGRERHERVAGLMKSARISFCVDTEEGARGASEFYAAAGLQPEVLVEVDAGYGRCGVAWDGRESIEFARLVSELPGLKLTGILTHAGHSYHGPAEGESLEEALRRVSAEERDRMLAFASRLGQAGLARPGDFEISIGSTPSMAVFENTAQDDFSITEIRPGNYIFNDAMQVALGSARLADCALTVLATVVSRHRDRAGRERVFLDAGKKILSSDTGYGTDGHGILLYNPKAMVPMPHAHLAALSEEHGWVQVSGGATLAVGDRVQIVPNHACVAVHTRDLLYVVEDGELVDTLPVEARGKTF